MKSLVLVWRAMPCVRSTGLIALVCMVSVVEMGCSSSAEIVARQSSKADDTFEKTEVMYFWGLMDVQESVDCGGDGLHVVSASTNWFYSLCTVVTLGAVVPMDVTYRCTTGSLDGGGQLGEARPRDER